MTEIEKYNPCAEAIEFRRQFKTFKEAWNNCPRGDWMLWIAKRLEVDEKLLYKASALCAKTVKHLMIDQRSKDAVQAALNYADGKISKEELLAVWGASWVVSDPWVAYYTAWAAGGDAWAAWAAYYNAWAAGGGDAYKEENQLQTADICREILTDAILDKI